MTTSLSQVASKWSTYEPDISKTYFGFAPLRPYLIRTAFGEDATAAHRDNRYWAEDILVSNYLADRKIERVLSICCGFGIVEQRIISQLGSIKECLGLDVAEGALKVAHERAVAAGLKITYSCVDLNHYLWEKEAYDLIIANGSLHHLWNLEQVIPSLRNALRPGGLLYANEHVGASYQDYPQRQLELINAVAYLLPKHIRKSSNVHRKKNWFLKQFNKLRYIPAPATRPNWSTHKKVLASLLRQLFGEEETKFELPILHTSLKPYLLKTDPSEGVRSADIIPLIQKHFTEVEIRPYGGAILAYAIDQNFFNNYDVDNTNDQNFLDLLCQIEEYFTATNQIGPEHAIIIAQKPAGI